MNNVNSRFPICRLGGKLAFSLVLLATLVLGAGCGSSMQPPRPVVTGTTNLVVQMTSTANGRFTGFEMTLSNVSLIDQTGKAVALINTPQKAEFSHVNGGATPLATVSVPQGVYTAVSVTYSDGLFEFLTPATPTLGVGIQMFQAILGSQQATVEMAAPITVSGKAMGLTLDLQESRSASCVCDGVSNSFSITPVFKAVPFQIAIQPTNEQNGKIVGLSGRISAVGAGSTNITLSVDNGFSFSPSPSGPTLQLVLDDATAYQGVTGATSLLPGEFMDADVAVQSDGSLLATRVEVRDPQALNTMIGLVFSSSSLVPVFVQEGIQQQGDDLSVNPIDALSYAFSASTRFQTSGRVAVPADLPFTASFDGSSLALGQNVAVNFMQQSFTGASQTQADAVTLMPQTLNGTVSSVTTSGAYTVYQVSLQAADPVVVASGKNTVTIYLNSATQMLNSGAIALGSIVRFNGLLFNDAGTFRMYAARVNDGVAD